MKLLKEEILKIKEQAIKKAKEAVAEIDQENKKIQGIIFLLLMEYFEQYSRDGSLRVNRYQRQTILKELEGRIIEETKIRGYQDVEYAKRILEEIIRETYERHESILGANKEVLLNPLLIQEIILKDYKGDDFENRVLNNKRRLAGRLYVEFDKILLNDSTLEEAANKLGEVFKKSNYDNYRLLMNEQGRVFDEVQTAVFVSEIRIEKLEWVSVLCDNTCPYCEMMDGSVFEINDPGRPEIPAHVLCQCCWVPTR